MEMTSLTGNLCTPLFKEEPAAAHGDQCHHRGDH